MTLPASGAMRMGADVDVQLGHSSSTSISLGGSECRTLSGVPSGAIRLGADFYGKPHAVAFDANQTAIAYVTDGTTPLNTSGLTIGSGSNRALVVAISLRGVSISSQSMHWDPSGTNQALTLITSLSTTAFTTQLWGLVNPTSGNKVLSTTWSGSAICTMNGTSFTGVDQTGGTTSFPHATSTSDTSGTVTAPSLTVTSAANNAAMACLAVYVNPTISAPTQTQTFLSNNSNARCGASRAAGAATVAFGWTLSSGNTFNIVGCDIKAY